MFSDPELYTEYESLSSGHYNDNDRRKVKHRNLIHWATVTQGTDAEFTSLLSTILSTCTSEWDAKDRYNLRLKLSMHVKQAANL